MKHIEPRTIKKGSLTNKNYRVYHPNGKLMFLCDEKRCNWYLSRNLATPGEECIHLNFEPAGVGFDESDTFGLTPRVVRCVCCGDITDGVLQRHHIVPYMYRKYMPIDYKSKNHHDVVLMCYNCHDEYERHATQLKHDISAEHNMLLTVQPKKVIEKNMNGKEGQHKHVASYITALMFHADKIPCDVKNNMKVGIASFLEKEDFTIEDLQNAYDFIQTSQREILAERVPVGKQIMERLTDLDDFLFRWRKHFVTTMQPKYMPHGWDILRTYRPRIN